MAPAEDSMAEVDRIFGGKFFPSIESRHDDQATGDGGDQSKPQSQPREEEEEESRPPPDESNDPVESQPAPQQLPRREWIAELRKVAQFADREGKKHVIGLENYKATARSSRRRGAPEHQPFKDYALLLKAVLENDGDLRTKVKFVLELQSEGLRSVFRAIATPYRELRLDSDPIVIQYPFRCLFFLRGKLRDLSQAAETSARTRAELGRLLEFIHSPMGLQRFIDPYNELAPRGKITFPMFWALFPPYEPVIWRDWHDDGLRGTGYLLESVDLKDDKKHTFWELSLLCGYHDGTKFRVQRTTKTVNYFGGAVDIDLRQIPVIPLNMIKEPQRSEIRASLIERGKKYVQFCKSDSTFMHYKGPVVLGEADSQKRLADPESGRFLTIQIDERVMIDRTAEKMFGNVDDSAGETVSSCLSEHLSPSTTGDAELAKPLFNDNQDGLRDLLRMNVGGGQTSGSADPVVEEWILDPKSYAKPKEPELTDDDFFICRSVLTAFTLDQKLWVYHVRVSRLQPIKWESDPFQSLQLSEDSKTLVYRLVKGFSSGKTDVYDDVIKGKGKGLIFLLHGAPGLGKTLTAESVAESARRPLYRITTGELSTEVSQLEKQLRDIFRAGARWRAVVLMDEADVLMSERTVTDLTRNSIVAVFLRLLEYYRGMLFLTTNRHKDFDDAFYSRIHVTIEYGDLTAEWRTNIWREHIQRASEDNKCPSLWTEDMFKALGEIDTNGRDIKNYTRTAYAFARAEDEDLTLSDALIVLKNNLSKEKLEAQTDTFKKLDALAEKLPGGAKKWKTKSRGNGGKTRGDAEGTGVEAADLQDSTTASEA